MNLVLGHKSKPSVIYTLTVSTQQDDNRPHVVIVGGGVAGCTLAYELSFLPVRVTLLESGQVAQQGASSVPVALLNPHRGRTARASELDKRGLEAVTDLAQRLESEGLDPGVHFPGVLRIASDEKQLKKWKKVEGLRQLSASDISTPYHAPFGGVLVEKGGWLEPTKFLTALLASAQRRGVKVFENCTVQGVSKSAGGWVVNSTQGNFEAAKVVLCVGATENPGLPLPGLERLAGDVVELRSGVVLPYPIAGAVYGMSKGNSVFMGGNHRPAGERDPEAAERLQNSAGWFIKPLKDTELLSVWTGVRAKKEDNQPLVTELEPDLWFYGALAGRGFLCAAYLSRRLARQLARSSVQP